MHSGDNKFHGAVTVSGLVVFAPRNSDCVGTYNATASTYSCIDISPTISRGGKFIGATATGDGFAVFAPFKAGCVGLFKVTTGTFACLDVTSTISTSNKFGGATTASNGLVVFSPYDADCVGTLAHAACDTLNLTCDSGFYPASCGISTAGLVSADTAQSPGQCSPCTNAGDGQYYTGQGGLVNVDACPTASCSDLVCEPGTYRASCHGLSAGYCAACDADSLPPDYFLNLTAAEACAGAACINLPRCAVGEYRFGCAAFSQGSCLPCSRVPDRYFITDGGLSDSCATSPCLDEPQCRTGEYRAACGAASAGFCTPCTIKAANEYFTSHGGIRDACYAARCNNMACPAGEVRRGRCGDDTTRSNNDYTCEACRQGTFQHNSSMTDCLTCAHGKFQPAEGATACIRCKPGYYCPTGAPAALPCAEGSFSDSSNLASDTECTPTDPGFFAPTGSVKPTPCAAGMVASTGGLGACVACTAGRYQDTIGATACKDCDAGAYCKSGAAVPLPCEGGTFASATNLTSATQCTVADPGHFSPTASAAQRSCRVDMYHPDAGQSSDVACISCSRDSTTNGLEARTQVSDCICKAGFFEQNATTKWETGIVDCRPCSDVHETKTIDMTNCTAAGATLDRIPVLPGFWRQRANSTIVRACDKKRFCSGGDRPGDASCAQGHRGPMCDRRWCHSNMCACGAGRSGTSRHRVNTPPPCCCSVCARAPV
jgi:hypothetical protein